MADKEDKNEENVGGKFYVDSQCIDCDLCRETAPSNFTRADDEGYSFVFKQPENDEEIEQCKEAMEQCLLRQSVRTVRINSTARATEKEADAPGSNP